MEKEWFLTNRNFHVISGRNGLYATDFGLDILRNIPGSGLWLPVYANLPTKLVHTFLETADGAIFAGCDGGIYKSTDSGENWKQVLPEGNVATLVEANGVLLGGCEKGVLRSTDGGEHWEQVMD